MLSLIAGLVLFLGVHSLAIVAPAARGRWAAQLGAGRWQLLHGLIALAGFALLVHGYGLARHDPVVLYAPPAWARHLALLLMLPVFPLLLATYLPGRIQATLKHPLLAATKAWALAHLLANGTLAAVILFGSLLAWAVADRISLKRRVPRALRTAPPGRWNDWIAVLGGLALYVLFVKALHLRLIGVSPLG